MSVLVDTSVWYATLDRADRSHSRAADIVGSLAAPLVTDHILVEVHRLADHRLGRGVADTFLETLVASGTSVEIVGRPDLEHAIRIRASFPDQAFSLVDCTSFSVMERLGVTEAASFDADFSVYRFGPRRDRAFTVRG